MSRVRIAKAAGDLGDGQVATTEVSLGLFLTAIIEQRAIGNAGFGQAALKRANIHRQRIRHSDDGEIAGQELPNCSQYEVLNWKVSRRVCRIARRFSGALRMIAGRHVGRTVSRAHVLPAI